MVDIVSFIRRRAASRRDTCEIQIADIEQAVTDIQCQLISQTVTKASERLISKRGFRIEETVGAGESGAITEC